MERKFLPFGDGRVGAFRAALGRRRRWSWLVAFTSAALFALLGIAGERYQVPAGVARAHERLEEAFHLLVRPLLGENGNLDGEVLAGRRHDVHLALHPEEHRRELTRVATRRQNFLQAQLRQRLMRRAGEDDWKLQGVDERTRLALRVEVRGDGRRFLQLLVLSEREVHARVALPTRVGIEAAFVAGRLHRMAALRAPADGENVARVVLAPIVERATPAIKCHVDLVVLHSRNGCTADQLRILLVHRFQFVSDLEEVPLRRLRLGLEDLRRRHLRPVQRLRQERGPAAGVHAKSQRRLQHPTVPLAVADGFDLTRVDEAPEVVFVVAAVKPQPQPRSQHAHDRRDANRIHIARIDGLKLHPDFKFVLRWVEGLLEALGGRGNRTSFLKL